MLTRLIITICALWAAFTIFPLSVYAVPDGKGNEIFSSSNVGVGTNSPQARFVVTSGNVGIGTWTAAGGNLIINGGGNVGIGSAWPGKKLDVTGTVRATAFVGDGSGLTGLSAISGLTPNAIPKAASATTINDSSIYQSGTNIGIGTTSAQTAFAVTNGNVGIGTWTTDNALDVVGNISSNTVTIGNTSVVLPLSIQGDALLQDLFVGYNSGSSAARIETYGASASSIISIQGTAGLVGIGTVTPVGGTSIMNGNVGIGTWVPNNILDVAGGVGIGNGSASSYVTTAAPVGGMIVENNVGIGTTTPQSKLAIIGNVGIGTWSTAGGALIVNGGGNVGIGSAWPGKTLDVNGTVRASAFVGDGSGLSSVSGTVSGLNAGYISKSSSATAINDSSLFQSGNNLGLGTITPQGSLVVTNGNVGIGTWSPSSPLSVGANAFTVSQTGAVNALNFVSVNSSRLGNVVVGNGTNSQIQGASGSGGSINLQNTTGEAFTFTSYGGTTAQNVFVFNATPNAVENLLQVQNSASPVMTVSSAGNLGIGTTTPQSVLTVMNGNVGIGTWTADGGNLIIRGGGNVGIGSAWPGKTLDVNGTVRATAFVGDGTGLTSVSGTISGLNAGYITKSSSATAVNDSSLFQLGNNLGLGTVTPQASFVVTNGNVGIGTWTGQSDLDIVNVAPTIRLGSTNGVSGGRFVTNVSTANSYAYRFYSNNFATTLLSMYAGGNIGISTVFPTALLDISSTANQDLFRINDNGELDSTPFLVTAAGNVGIGTSDPFGGQLIIASGNVGIGSLTPGKTLDVTGTVRATAFVGDGSGLTNVSSQWATQNTTDVSLAGGNVGIGTTLTTTSALAVMNGNVGIGTWVPFANLSVEGGALGFDIASFKRSTTSGGAGYSVDINGNGSDPQIRFNANNDWAIGQRILDNTFILSYGSTLGAGAEKLSILSSGNVGIGTFAPNALLNVSSTAAQDLFRVNDNGTDDVSPFIISLNGNVGIGTAVVTDRLLTVDASGAGTGNRFSVSAGAAGSSNREFTLIPYATGTAGQGGWGIQTLVNSTQIATGTTLAMQYLGGNIGIGTIHTTNFVEISTTSNQNLFVVNDNGAGDTTPFVIAQDGNVGIGTTVAQTQLAVVGNVGIGTWTTAGGALIINGGGNVGIGSAWPGQTLDVNGTVRATAFIGDGSALSNISAGGWTDGGANVYLSTGTDKIGLGTQSPQGAFVVTNGNVGIGTWAPRGLLELSAALPNSPLIVTNAGNVGMGTIRTESAGLTVMNGNVGIGTWKPEYILETTGTINSQNLVRAANGFQSIGSFLLTYSSMTSGSSNGFTFSNTSDTNPHFIFQNTSSNTERMRINGVGNVGIGTVEPASLLTVAGGVGIGTGFNSTYVSTAAPAGGIIVESNVGIGTRTPQTKLAVIGNVGIGTWSTAGGALIVNGGGNVGIGSAWPGKTLDVNGTVRATAFVGDGSGLTGVGSQWATQNTTDVSLAGGNVGIGTNKTTTAALTVMNGNVGIGTWVAEDPLHVQGSANITNISIQGPSGRYGQLYINDAAYVAGLNVGSGGYLLFMVASSGVLQLTDSAVQTYPGVNVGIGTTPQAGLVVLNNNVGIGTWTAGGGNLIVNGGGNVGINSAWPGKTLDVNGTVRATAFIGDGSGLTGISGSSSGWTLGASNIGISTTNNVGIGTSSTQGALVVTSGNVGIGTWAPRGLLEITAGLPNSPLIIDSNGNIGMGTTRTTTSALSIMTGNVGIGTWKPGYELTVVPSSNGIQVTETDEPSKSAITLGGSSTGGAINVLSGGSTKLLLTATATTSYFNVSGQSIGIGTSIPTGGLAVMSGNVGIGTWKPGAALQVSNNMTFSSEYDNGNKGANFGIDWNNGNKQKVTLTAANLTVTFTPPSVGVGNLTLKIVQGGAGSMTITTWTSTKWPSGTLPTLSTAAGAIDFITCYYDGSSYYCTSSLNFQ